MLQKPNIIIILCDDLGYGDPSCYGQSHWQTPNIDKLANEGIRFTDFYSASPVCSPARASLLTGLHSGHLPIRNLRDSYLPDDVTTIPKLLKDAGYVSACIGKYGVGNGQPDLDPIKKGFDYHFGYNCMRHAHNYFPPFLRENGVKVPLRNLPPEGDDFQWETGIGVAEVKIDYSPDFLEDRAVEFIRDCQDRSFFLHFCLTLPHANNEGGYTTDGMEVDSYGDFEYKDWPPNEKGFARMVQRIDQSVGRIMQELTSLGIADNTLVLFTSDNGPHNEGGHSVTAFDSTAGFQGYKRSLHEGGIRVPFIAWWPGTVEPQVSNRMGYFPDILKTLAEATGADAHGIQDGLSFYPLLLNQADQQSDHEHLYFEFDGQIAVRQGNWKYFSDSDGNERLYDLLSDPHEDNDVKSDNPDVFHSLKLIAESEHENYSPTESPISYSPTFLRGKK
ncbi:arylsulfatase [Vibrio sp. J1-1]|uniref:arylsulfatase n=1 Tax=Vibrio sp. J1-1 TaxID=2912251 RepID=UPI001F2AEB0F|nr:arylsulfatase [Vibrio sp. J1-1]MCF7480508.1 arylsulfatase [Vibrio sp. J1-1]